MIVLLMLLSLTAFAGECDHTLARFSCVKYLYNYDGDTITVTIPGVHAFFGEKAKVRVYGIDSPELKSNAPCETEWGRVAKNLVKAELKHAKFIHLTNLHGRDKYGRILAEVEYDGKNLSQVLLKNHLAVPYFGKTKSKVNWCKEQEKKKNESKKL